MSGLKFERNKLRNLFKNENDYILDLLATSNVPDSIEDTNYSDYLLDKAGKRPNTAVNEKCNTVEELEIRLNTIKNKMKSKKRVVSKKSLKKREAKKLKQNKEYKKVLRTANSLIENEKESLKKNVAKQIQNPVPKSEEKMVFSKFDFSAHLGAKQQKPKKDRTTNNPKEILKKLKESEKTLHALKEQGEDAKVNEIKTELKWKKAFQKIEGKKVKDDPKLLYKAIKRKKDEHKKSKQKWIERKKKVETSVQNRQKQRTENINKKLKDKTNKKLKKLSKKGRIIPGY